jgi:hypothetical protein
MYLKYLEDNLNHKFTKEMDEYKNYIKMFYNEKAKCPKDLKTPLQRTQDDKKIELWCNNWKVSIIKPVVVNLKFLQESLSIIYKKNSDLFKYKLRQNMDSSTYKPDNDNEVRDMLVELKKIEEEITSIKSIFEKQKEMIDEIIKKKKDTLKKLAEIKIKKENKYNECIDISKDVFIKLKEISKNEENITEQRFTQISKSVKLSLKDTKNWIEYFKFIIAYIKENDVLYQSNQILIDLQNKFENINANYIIEPPKISTK